MYTVKFTEYYGPFCGQGGYGGGIGIGMSRSPKTAMKKALHEHAKTSAGGGVTILFGLEIWKDGKLIKKEGDF